uniref:Uncharacterized protein n=1 Tax=Astyanax mexicanus TaxID=7994 RepID=A0A3B1JES5_ASTMX
MNLGIVILEYVRGINLKLQGKDRLICHLFEAVCAFEMKLNLFATQLKKGNLTHFPTCQEAFAHKNYNWSRHSCVLEDLKLAFSARFGQFRNEQATLQLLADPFSVDTETVPGELQLEIIELKCSTAMKTKHREMPLLEFYQSLDREQFPNLFANNLQAVLRLATTSLEPDINQLVSERRCNISH